MNLPANPLLKRAPSVRTALRLKHCAMGASIQLSRGTFWSTRFWPARWAAEFTGFTCVFASETAAIRLWKLSVLEPSVSLLLLLDRFVWTGSWRGLQYRCICGLSPVGDAWFFRVEVDNRSDKAIDCDVVMVQDIGLATRGQVRNNENYTSQYLDHFATWHSEVGYLVMSRQNLPQPGETHPWLLQGCFPGAAGFTTDGFDFFGVGYKMDGVPAALSRSTIGQRVRQYESGFTALQSVNDDIQPENRSVFSFFSNFVADHPEASSVLDVDGAKLRNWRESAGEMASEPADSEKALTVKSARSLFQKADLYEAEDFDESDIRSQFPGPLRHEEFDGSKRLSFFCDPQSRHIVLKAKEIAVARPHGHIMRSGRGLLPNAEVMSCACYSAGVFASQMALGNSVFGKFLSTVRDPLNIIRSSGLRIFVRHHSTGAGASWLFHPRSRWRRTIAAGITRGMGTF